ncbi:MAG: hypothetical protein WDA21_00800 [Bacilli bacterium]
MKKSRETVKKICKFGKKKISFFMVICLCLTSIGLNSIMSVFAGELGQKLTLTGGVANGDYIEFYDEETLMGKIQVTIGEDVLVPVGNKVVLPEFTDNYQVSFYLTCEEGYEVSNYDVEGVNYLTPGEGPINVSIISGDDLAVTFNFELFSNDPGPGPSGTYPLLAYFEGVIEPVESTSENTVLIPDGWTSGTISFKAKICEVGGEIRPDNGITECDPGTQALSDLEITAFIIVDELRGIVTGSEDDSHLNIDEGFDNVGKAGIHLGNNNINLTTDLISQSLINVEAIAPMKMDYSYGLSTIDETIVTNRTSGDVSIFFGNTEVTLKVTGPNVVGITNLTGAEYTLDEEDGSVSFPLPPLSKETTTSVTLTIELSDTSTVTRQINIIRTAIELSFYGENRRINAGYVMHKAYLYNNQSHNDEIFDAYLQVILYRNNKVVGYRQVQIDDEEYINNLEEDESGSIESVGPEPIVVYEGGIEGVNKVSVFLTNGPIDYNSNTLPSIEFGLGAGVVYEWEEN